VNGGRYDMDIIMEGLKMIDKVQALRSRDMIKEFLSARLSTQKH
jgi:hypothetical protein